MLHTIDRPSDPNNPSTFKFLSWKKKKEMPTRFRGGPVDLSEDRTI